MIKTVICGIKSEKKAIQYFVFIAILHLLVLKIFVKLITKIESGKFNLPKLNTYDIILT